MVLQKQRLPGLNNICIIKISAALLTGNYQLQGSSRVVYHRDRFLARYYF